MAWEKTKMTCLAAVCPLLALGIGTLVVREIQAHRVYPGLSGVWEGTNSNLRVALTIARTNGAYRASFHYVDYGLHFPADNLRLRSDSIRFRMAGADAGFDASINPPMTQMSGNWRQGANNFPVTLKHMATPDIEEPLTPTQYTPRAGSDLQGIWKGIIKSGARQLPVTLKIAEPEAARFRAEMGRDDWGGEHIPAVSMSRDGDTIKIPFRVLGTFEGKLDTAAGQLAGAWTQGGQTNLVTFTRVDLQTEQPSKNYTPAGPLDLQGHWKGTLKLPDGLPLNAQGITAYSFDASTSNSWVVGDATYSADLMYLKQGTLYPCLSQPGVYHCPTDQSVIDDRTATRNRSYSLNYYLNGGLDPQYTNGLPVGTLSSVVTRYSQVTKPSRVLAFLDENQYTIEDGVYLLFLPPDKTWQNAPSDRHDQGMNLTFTDGHCEHWSWLSPKKMTGLGFPASGPADLQDLSRLQAALISWP